MFKQPSYSLNVDIDSPDITIVLCLQSAESKSPVSTSTALHDNCVLLGQTSTIVLINEAFIRSDRLKLCHKTKVYIGMYV